MHQQKSPTRCTTLSFNSDGPKFRQKRFMSFVAPVAFLFVVSAALALVDTTAGAGTIDMFVLRLSDMAGMAGIVGMAGAGLLGTTKRTGSQIADVDAGKSPGSDGGRGGTLTAMERQGSVYLEQVRLAANQSLFAVVPASRRNIDLRANAHWMTSTEISRLMEKNPVLLNRMLGVPPSELLMIWQTASKQAVIVGRTVALIDRDTTGLSDAIDAEVFILQNPKDFIPPRRVTMLRNEITANGNATEDAALLSNKN
jgi:hypothetical protein